MFASDWNHSLIRLGFSTRQLDVFYLQWGRNLLYLEGIFE